MESRHWLLAGTVLSALVLAAPGPAFADDQKDEHKGQPQSQHPAPPPRPATAPPARPNGGPPPGQQHGYHGGPPPGPQAHAPAPPYGQPHPGSAPPYGGIMHAGPPHPPPMAARPSHEAFARHEEVRNQWHDEHREWHRDVVWGHDHYWWRGNPAFREYGGPRSGFFFAPGYGYYAVPQIYWGRHWGVGALLPLFFLSYAAADFAAYGLPPPPPGAEWVWVNNSILLVDISDGYVLDEMTNVW